MRYNRNIPKQSQTKGGIFIPKGGPKEQYTPELKIKVVETMQRERMSYREAALQFNIPQGDKTVQHLMCKMGIFCRVRMKKYNSFKGEVVSYNVSCHPNLNKVTDMLNQAFAKIPDNTDLILHSD